MSKKLISRTLGVGFALATATALVLPGVSAAAPTVDDGSSTGTLSGSSDGLPDLGVLSCVLDAVGFDFGSSEEESEEGADIDFEALLSCFGDLDGGGDQLPA